MTAQVPENVEFATKSHLTEKMIDPIHPWLPEGTRPTRSSAVIVDSTPSRSAVICRAGQYTPGPT